MPVVSLSKRLTGRTHQIRVHMSYWGYPLAGDVWYGGDLRIIPHQALHCFRCRFLHPINGERVELTAPLYESFKKALENAKIEWRESDFPKTLDD